MTPPGGYSEDALVEKPAIELFESLGWGTGNVFYESFGPSGTLGRESEHQVILLRRLEAALQRLNPGLSSELLAAAVDELALDRSTVSAVGGNRDVYRLLKDGVRVKVRQPDGTETVEVVQVIDWRDPGNNDFFLASQLWVAGDMYRRRCDLVGFVNGLPLLFVELKATHKNLLDAFQDNFRDYRGTIPQLFWFNGVVILSNGSESRIGSLAAAWDHFSEWKKINDEGERGIVSLETMIRGTCEPSRLLELIEHFTVFEEGKGGLVKILGMNHQVLGVNRAIEAVGRLGENRGRLGVFWHTQGSGKSVSMIFFAQKILRTLPGNWTFVIVTDRRELDGQIYKNFAACGAVTEKQAQAESAEDLKRLLSEDHRYVFTLIQKFRTEGGAPYPILSVRSDVVVITDEAHRSQYDTFALNMRIALPNASFIGFTGTPLMVGEEKTRDVFGDYVSVYNFRQSIEDGATVPLYYENRTPELQLTNPDLNEDMEQLLDDAMVDEEQEKKLEREFGREYHLITRDDRIEKVASDIVRHFMGRGHLGKAMVVAIDKATAVRTFDKVKRHWTEHLAELREELASVSDDDREARERKIAFMETTDMAVVVSQSQNEVEEMRDKGLDIVPHRKRIVTEDLDTKFKDPNDPFRIVFVCAMWMTGFDVPSCSTIYLDKPMRNHTLMQTIARANRRSPGKLAGLIVDYANVFRNLQKALAIYAAPLPGGEVGVGESPIRDKSELIGLLKAAIDETVAFCREHGVEPEDIKASTKFQRIALLDDAVDALVSTDEVRKKFLQLAARVGNFYKAILPDPTAGVCGPDFALFAVLAQKIRSLTLPADISDVMSQVEDLLDESIATQGYVIREPSGRRADELSPYGGLVDLSQIDFQALRAQFEAGRKRTEAQRLRALIGQSLQRLVRANRSRLDYLAKFQKLIDEYNSGSMNVEQFFQQLLVFAESLNEEEKRGVAEGLTEEELAVFDILSKPEPKLSKTDQAQVKKVARALLETLKGEKLVLDWRKRQQARQAVRLAIESELDKLPTAYIRELFEEKCNRTYQHVYDSYFGEGRSVYAVA